MEPEGSGINKISKLSNLNKLEIVSGASVKLQNLTSEFGMSSEVILSAASRSEERFVDLRNNGNINVLLNKPNNTSGKIRITTDPTASKIISAGQMKSNNVINNINKGNFVPLK